MIDLFHMQHLAESENFSVQGNVRSAKCLFALLSIIRINRELLHTYERPVGLDSLNDDRRVASHKRSWRNRRWLSESAGPWERGYERADALCVYLAARERLVEDAAEPLLAATGTFAGGLLQNSAVGAASSTATSRRR